MKRTLRTLALGCALAATLPASALAIDIKVNTPFDTIHVGDPLATPTKQALIGACIASTGVNPAGTVSVPPNTNPPTATVQTDACSLRMALTLAAVLGRTAGPARILFEVPDGSTIDTVEQEAGGTVSGTRVAALPPIVADNLVIDGCGVINPTAPTRPCVNIKLPNLVGALSAVSGVTGGAGAPGLIVAANNVTIKNVAFLGAATDIVVAPKITGTKIMGSYFGLNVAGVPAAADQVPSVGVLLAGDSAVIGGAETGNGNTFALGGVGVSILGGSNNVISGNRFGTDADGKKLSLPAGQTPLGTGVRVAGLGFDETGVGDQVNSALAGQGQHLDQLEGSLFFSTAKDNVIGGNPNVEQAQSGACDGPCNRFADVAGFGIDIGGSESIAGLGVISNVGSVGVTGARDTRIEGNQVGLHSDDSAGPNLEGGVIVRNGSIGTLIGGNAASKGNLISNNRNSGVTVRPSAGLGTLFERNFGRDNARLLLDLGDDGLGNPDNGPSGGVKAPTVQSAGARKVPGAPTPTHKLTVVGTATGGAKVQVYLLPRGTTSNAMDRYVGEATANAAGVWTATLNVVSDEFEEAGAGANAPRVPSARRVLATQNIGKGTSELSNSVGADLLPAEEVGPPPPVETGPGSGLGSEVQGQNVTDRVGPSVLTVLGRKYVPGSTLVFALRRLRELAGTLADASGIKRVQVALEVAGKGGSKATASRKRSRRKSRRRAAPRCQYLNLQSGRIVKRSCGSPPYVVAIGTAAWRVPLSPRVRGALKPGALYIIRLRATDTLNNKRNQRIPVRFK